MREKSQFFKKPIFTSLAPNEEKDDQILAFKLLISPDKWKEGKEINKVEKRLKKYLGVKYILSFNSGRSSFLSILNSIGLKKGDEILLQAFTCNAAVNPILWSGFHPVFVDCDKSFNLDPKHLEKKITPKSKAIVVQHTFGQPAEMKGIKMIAKKYKLLIIEDCAHSLGAKYEGKKIGTIGDVSLFSFSRDKIISSVYGGAVATNNREIFKKIKKYHDKLKYPSSLWIFQQLLYVILAPNIVIPSYRLPPLGKKLLQFLHFSKILSKSVHRKEKRGEKPNYFPKKFPNALAVLALNQLEKLDKFNNHRKKIAKIYSQELKQNKKIKFQDSVKYSKRVYMRFPVLVPEFIDTNKILAEFRREKIFLDDGWRKSPIVPPGTDLERMGYKIGECPNAENIAKRIINLPTHINISEEDARKIIRILNKIINDHKRDKQ